MCTLDCLYFQGLSVLSAIAVTGQGEVYCGIPSCPKGPTDATKWPESTIPGNLGGDQHSGPKHQVYTSWCWRNTSGLLGLCCALQRRRGPEHQDLQKTRPLEPKLGGIRTLHYWAQNVPTRTEGTEEEQTHIKTALKTCGYPRWSFIKKILHSPKRPRGERQ